MGILRPITTAHRHHKPNEITAHLKPSRTHRTGDDVGEQRVAGDHNIGSWHGYAQRKLGELKKEILHRGAIAII